MENVYIMLSAFAVMLVLGVPIAFSMALAAALVVALFEQVPLLLLPQLFFTATDNFSLLAIPLFIGAGALMAQGKITDQLVDFSMSMLGHFRGGLAHANVLANTCMAAVSGSATADVAAVGSIMIPAMSKGGYKDTFAVCVTSSAAMLATIIPPSVVAIVYATVAGVSVGDLFIAGAVPGLLAAVGIMALISVYAHRLGMPIQPRRSWAMRGASALSATPALLMPVIIVGGILSGLFTATESGAVACVYAFLYTIFKRRANVKELYEVILGASTITGAVMIVVGGTALFSWELVRSGAIDSLMTGILALSTNSYVGALAIVSLLLALGTVMEPVPAVILAGPLINGAISSFHLDPLSFGVTCLMVLILGAITPPVGILAMVACRIANISYASTFKPIVPFIILWIFIMMVVLFVPSLSNFLPSLISK